ncbi:DUF2993 domain-containing protein [uncultured Jatrophihabitans sp.]|uniref:LmeA family phospholipid-binding protein n=1 Tax=uncultured Jatrophihabitans sp. TaxID=1610747 RepID=UPI0035C950A9
MLVVLLAIADRVAAKIASTEAVSQIVQGSQGLATKPTVSFGGFPFLTQVIAGRYTDVSVGIDGLTPPNSVRIQRISAHLLGAHVPLSTLIHGTVSTIPIDHVTASLAFRFADLNAFLANQPGHLKLSWKSGAVQVSGRFVAAGEAIKVSGSTTLGVANGGLVITPTSLHVTGGGTLGDLASLLGGSLSAFPPVPVPLPGLPFHLRLTAVHSAATGLAASAAANGLVLDAGRT